MKANAAQTKAQATTTTQVDVVIAPTAPDANHGRGGMYTVVDGQRVLVERTLAEHEKFAANAAQPSVKE